MKKDVYKKEEISQINRETAIQEDNNQNGNSSKVVSPHSDDQWAEISSHIRKEIGDTAWRNWIKPLHFAGIESEIIQLETKSRLVRDRVSSHYYDKLCIS